MSQNVDIKSLKPALAKLVRAERKHVSFAAVMVVLIAYMVVIWQISKLAVAEPSPEAMAASETKIPKVDKKAIGQIEALEQNNTQVQSLFNQARNNPFQE